MAIDQSSNGFPHQAYDVAPKSDCYRILDHHGPVEFGSEAFSQKMSSIGLSLHDANVARIILVHGTMAGTDALGWYSHWQRVVPGLSKKLKTVYKSVVDRLAGDRGNFTEDYASKLQASLNAHKEHGVVDAAETVIQVEQFHWTSENHHLGRSNAAVKLIKRLFEVENDGRVLLIGHSHAANVFALVSNLLVNSPEVNQKFFDASRHFNESSGRIDVPGWQEVRTELARRFVSRSSGSQSVLVKPAFVTLGGPIRYGWNSDGFEGLLHFVNHRVMSEPGLSHEEFRAYVPKSSQELLAAIKGEFGDFVQQCFIARTDFPPAIWSWPAWTANRQLRNLLEGSELKNKRLWRFKQGKRVAESGLTLLVDYSKADSTAKDVAGHSIYTELDSMEFQMEQIARNLFGFVEG